MKQFNLEEQYQLYLQRVDLKERDMHYDQRIQLRQAFFGACGQMLILLRDELSKLDENTAIAILQDMINQVSDYFLQITNRKS